MTLLQWEITSMTLLQWEITSMALLQWEITFMTITMRNYFYNYYNEKLLLWLLQWEITNRVIEVISHCNSHRSNFSL
jgi:hypothetical protein